MVILNSLDILLSYTFTTFVQKIIEKMSVFMSLTSIYSRTHSHKKWRNNFDLVGKGRALYTLAATLPLIFHMVYLLHLHITNIK